MSDLTKEKLDELETLAKAATQGGWRAGRSDMQSYDAQTGEPFKNVYGPNFEPELHHGERIPVEVAKAVGGNCMADAQFIGALHPEVALSLIAAARELSDLKSALEFLDRGDGNRGTHGTDMRAPALLEMARRLGWSEP